MTGVLILGICLISLLILLLIHAKFLNSRHDLVLLNRLKSFLTDQLVG